MKVLKFTPIRDIIVRWNDKLALKTEIPLIDQTIGGFLPGNLHMIRGVSGVGKTWFCLRAISSLLQDKSKTKVLYSDFHGHLRFSNLKKICPSSNQLDQINIFQPATLIEQIIFFRTLREKSDIVLDLVILDSIFGSPINAFQYFYTEPKLWKKRVLSHISDLKILAQEKMIPILLTNHLIQADEDVNKQFGQKLLEPFVPINLLIQKTDSGHFIEFKLFQKIIGNTNFDLTKFTKFLN